MEYKNIFEIEFIQRTQEIVNGYQIPFENTLLIIVFITIEQPKLIRNIRV